MSKYLPILKEQFKNFCSREQLTIRRDIMNQIDRYVKPPHAIIVSGLRRVGKSTLLSQIAKQFYNQSEYYFINFEAGDFIGLKAEDFNSLHADLIQLFGERKVFFLDEIQNITGWETFARELIDNGYKLFITGSNASLLSRELGTKLTGRHLDIELFPFSFQEYLKFNNFDIESMGKIWTITEEAKVKRHLMKYLKKGGIPDELKYPESNIAEQIYADVLHRDVIVRHGIDSVAAIKELAFYLISNIARPLSYNKLRQQLMLGSVNTVKNFVSFLENSWLIGTINKFAYSVKTQQIAAKKIYGIDTGLIQKVAFKATSDTGRLLENLVFLELKRRKQSPYYYICATGGEVDFYLREENALIQVTQSLSEDSTFNRDLKAIKDARDELKSKNTQILVLDDVQKFPKKIDGIKIVPIYKWLLNK